jgi:hypothetical protein
MAGLITMISMLVIFFIEFASARYLSRIDEKIMEMQLRESGGQDSIIDPISTFLTRQKVVVDGKRVGISEAIAGQAAQHTAEQVIRQTPGHPVDEESPLLEHQNNMRKTDSSSRRDSHCGHHHYDPPPVDGSDIEDSATRRSQLLAVGIMEGGLCFHSIFVGLTLAVATGGGFVSLLTAIMFHRTSYSDSD